MLEVLPDPAEVPPGCEMVLGRLTRKHASTRPPRIMPEMWSAMTKKQKHDAITNYEKEKLKRKEFEALNVRVQPAHSEQPQDPNDDVSADGKPLPSSSASAGGTYAAAVAAEMLCPEMPIACVTAQHGEHLLPQAQCPITDSAMVAR